MEGQLLGNRYELLEKIGGGGMAVVYKARCRLLNRYVAVKILRPEFNEDEEFVRRFQIEAQSAARLSHPNIVSIYDVGQEGKLYYIVMEFVDGITLKEYIRKRGSLPWREACNIAIQICSALEHAHRNHIVHRDIKPHNIILTEDMIAKVTDFGIARAVSTSTLTMVGNTIGSVHYFSPEQARGGYIDEKSDLYSLGITMYEMVTGRVPFDGDSPVSVALKHIQEEPVPPALRNSSIPLGLNNIILKAIEKDSRSRYQSASEMLNDLKMCLKEPYSSIVTVNNDDFEAPTRRVPVVTGQKPDQDSKPKSENEDTITNLKLDAVGKEESEDTSEETEKVKKKKKKKDHTTVWMAVMTIVVILGLISYVGFNYLYPMFFTALPNEFVVPDLVGLTLTEAQAKINDERVIIRVEEETFDEVQPKGAIIWQDKAAQSVLKPPVTINVIVSKGPNVVEVPNVVNIDYRLAEVEIKAEGLNPQRVDEYSDKPVGMVTRTDPKANESVPPGSNIIVYVSKGPEIKRIPVPDLTGKTMDEVRRIVSDYGLTLAEPKEEESNMPAGTVIRQSPAPNTEVSEKTPVEVTLAKKQSGPVLSTTTFTLYLGNYEPKGNKVRVRVEVTNTETKQKVIAFNEDVNKNDFPKAISISGRGKVIIAVYYDNIKQSEQPYTFGN